MSLLDGCSDSCGWTAALVALVCYGTYGVPIKQTMTTEQQDVNPLVFQTYKTIVMLVVAPCLVTLVSSSNNNAWWHHWSPGWGFLSGLLWVLGGTCGVVAVRWAGMSTAVATWASVMIVINFVWGILIFREPVANLSHTAGAFGLLGLGLIGMSHFAAPPSSAAARYDEENEEDSQHQQPLVVASAEDAEEEAMELFVSGDSDDDDGNFSMTRRRQNHSDTTGIFLENGSQQRRSSVMIRRSLSSPDSNNDSSLLVDDDDENVEITPPLLFHPETQVRLGGKVYRKRQIGILAAVANGILAGSSLIPVHYAKQHGLGGANYMMSYAVGAFTANLLVWLMYYIVVLVVVVRRRPPLSSSWGDRLVRAAGDMPDPHWNQLWKPGICAGLLLSMAMFGSILAVTYLGQGIGNSVIQAKIIISGMWGIFYYKEIRDPKAIRNWFLSATLSVVAIIWLSRERIAAKGAATATVAVNGTY